MPKYKQFYLKIWDSRKEEDLEGRYYVECDCERRIYEEFLTVHNFAHIKSKGAAPELKYDPNNVRIRCYMCHASERVSGKNYDKLPIA